MERKMKLGPDDLKLAIRYAMSANVPLLSWGGSGAGKSAITAQAAEEEYESIRRKESYLYETVPAIRKQMDKYPDEFGYEFHDLRLAHVDISEWGLLRTFVEVGVRDPETGRVFQTKVVPVGEEISGNWEVLDYVHMSTRPHWFPREDSSKLHVLFMDEPNRAEDQTAINGTMQILAERSLKHRMSSPGFRIIGAANPPVGNFATEELNTASQNRWCHVDFNPNTEKFLANRNKHVDPFVINVLNSRPNLLINDQVPPTWAAEAQAFYTPRAWEMQSRIGHFAIWAQTQGKPLKGNVLQAMTYGMIGPIAGKSWIDSYKKGIIVSISKLLSGEQTYDRLYEASPGYTIAMAWELRSNLKDDMILTEEHGSRLADFILSLKQERKDSAAMLLRKIINNGGSNAQKYLLSNSDILDFITDLADELL
jgi:hypothetical protein